MAVERMISMNIRQTTSLNAVITVKDDKGNEVPVLSVNASLNNTNMNMSINTSSINQTLASDPANAAVIQGQFDSFLEAVRTKAKEIGFTFFA